MPVLEQMYQQTTITLFLNLKEWRLVLQLMNHFIKYDIFGVYIKLFLLYQLQPNYQINLPSVSMQAHKIDYFVSQRTP